MSQQVDARFRLGNVTLAANQTWTVYLVTQTQIQTASQLFTTAAADYKAVASSLATAIGGVSGFTSSPSTTTC
jgi:hypothetical protein